MFFKWYRLVIFAETCASAELSLAAGNSSLGFPWIPELDKSFSWVSGMTVPSAVSLYPSHIPFVPTLKTRKPSHN